MILALKMMQFVLEQEAQDNIRLVASFEQSAYFDTYYDFLLREKFLQKSAMMKDGPDHCCATNAVSTRYIFVYSLWLSNMKL